MSPLFISVHRIAMETPLRAIEMSDSSSLGINPSLAAEFHHVCVFVCFGTCLHFCFTFCVCVCMHMCASEIYFMEIFLELLIAVRIVFWVTVTELGRSFASW